MGKGKHAIFKLFQIVIVFIAVVNLAALFLFDNQIPGLPASSSSEAASADEVSAMQAENISGYTIQMDTDTLVYDGSGSLNLLDGVALVDGDGKVVGNDIFAHIKTGSSLSEKIIEYSADTVDGQVTASRILTLKNYNGPSIQLPDSLPQIEDDQLDDMVKYLDSDADFLVDDGYGNDISSAVSAKYTVDANDSNIIHYVFTVTNSYNDSASASADLSLIPTKPVLTLTENEVTIELHSSFSPLQYVASAKDVDGTSLSSRIQIQGEVDTDTAGEYVLTYFVTSSEGVSSAKKELKVTVR